MRLSALLLVVACHAGDAVDPDTDPADSDLVAACDGPVALVFAPELLGPGDQMPDGVDVPYGIPPQGGAPFAPLQTIVRGPVSGDDPPVAWAVATDVDSGEVIGTDHVAPDPGTPVRSWVCSNVGAFAGWWYAGEIHLRFWDHTLDDLEGRDVRFELRITLPGGVVASQTATGRLHAPPADPAR